VTGREVIAKLPDRFDPHDGFIVPNDLIGATIVRFGTWQSDIADPLLVIEYKTSSGKKRRLELAFNDRAMWVHRSQSG
jgi:hypothetical protein